MFKSRIREESSKIDILKAVSFRIIILCCLAFVFTTLISLLYIIIDVKQEFILTNLIIFSLASFLIYKHSGRLNILDPALLFLLLYTIFIYIGTIFLYIHNEVSAMSLIMVSTGLLSFSIGTFIAAILLNFHPKLEIGRFRNRKINDTIKGTKFNLNAMLAILSAFLIIITMVQAFGIPMLSKNPTEAYVSMARSNASSAITLSFQIILPLFSMLVLAKGLLYNQRVTRLFAILLAIISTLLMIIMTSRRYFALDFAMWIIIMYSCFHKLRMKAKWLVILALGFLIFFSAFELIRLPPAQQHISFGDKMLYLMDRIEHRIFLTEATGVNILLTLLPAKHDFFWGYTYTEQMKSIIPGQKPEFLLGDWLYEAKFGKSSIPGYLPPTALGELYANFGLLALFGMFIWGYILQFVFITFVRSRKKYIHNFVLYAIITGHFARSSLLGLYGGLINIIYIFLGFIALFILPQMFLTMIDKSVLASEGVGNGKEQS